MGTTTRVPAQRVGWQHRVRTVTPWVAGAAVLVFGLAACSDSDSDGESTPTASSSASAASSEDSAQALTDQYLRSPSPTPSALATVNGTITTLTHGQEPAQAQILSLRTTDVSTVLRWSLSTSSADVQPDPVQFSVGKLHTNTGAIQLISRSTNQRFEVNRWLLEDERSCTCSGTPVKLGPTGVELSAEFPPLPDAVTEVQVQIPGFPAASVPVSRA